MAISKTIKQIEDIIKRDNPYMGREGVVYVRVSSKRQELEGHGRESQEERCKQDLRHQNVPYCKTFADTFTGAGDPMKRPAMQEMIAFIDANPQKRFVVVFDDIKRLARDVQAHFILRAAFRSRDVEVRCPNYNFDETEEGEFVEHIFAAQAQLDRKQNRRQVVQKMKARLQLGYWPFAGKRGYDFVKNPIHGRIHVPNRDGTILSDAIKKFSTGDLVRKIDVARFLHERGFWKTSKRKAEYFIDEVSALLKDIFHSGYIEYKPWEVTRRKGQHKGLISLEVFEMVQKRLNREETKAHIRLDISPEFPLRGLLLCPGCQSKLTGAISKGRKKHYSYYYCITKGCEMYAKSLPKHKVESDFNDLLKHCHLKEEVNEVVKLVFDKVWKQEIQELKKKQLRDDNQKMIFEEKIRGLSELARTARSESLKNAYENQIEHTITELEKLGPKENKRDFKVPYRTALDKSLTLLKNPIKIWEKLDTVEKQRLFYFLFEKKLTYTKDEGFRTAKELSSTRIFEEFADADSDDVDPTGLEPATPSLQMRCSTR